MIDDTDILKAVRAQLKAAWPDLDVNLDEVLPAAVLLPEIL